MSGSLGYPLGSVAAVAVTIVTVAAHATSHPLWSVTVLAVTAGAIATVTTLPAALATAAVCWALHAGFVFGRHGNLQLSPTSAGAATVLGAVTVIAYLAGVAVRAGRRHRRTVTMIPSPRTPTTPRLSDSRSAPA